MPKTVVRPSTSPSTGSAHDGHNGSAADLQTFLTDLIVLALHAKQAHWNLTGPLFKPLHESLDAMTAEYRAWYDDVAERIRALGAAADGRPATVAGGADADDFPAGVISDQEVLRRMTSLIEGAAGRIRSRLEAIGEHDLVSQDLLVGIVHGLDKQAWMLRAHRS
jgi:starvation-inducible DNA-binding protein